MATAARCNPSTTLLDKAMKFYNQTHATIVTAKNRILKICNHYQSEIERLNGEKFEKESDRSASIDAQIQAALKENTDVVNAAADSVKSGQPYNPPRYVPTQNDTTVRLFNNEAIVTPPLAAAGTGDTGSTVVSSGATGSMPAAAGSTGPNSSTKSAGATGFMPAAASSTDRPATVESPEAIHSVPATLPGGTQDAISTPQSPLPTGTAASAPPPPPTPIPAGGLPSPATVSGPGSVSGSPGGSSSPATSSGSGAGSGSGGSGGSGAQAGDGKSNPQLDQASRRQGRHGQAAGRPVCNPHAGGLDSRASACLRGAERRSLAHSSPSAGRSGRHRLSRDLAHRRRGPRWPRSRWRRPGRRRIRWRRRPQRRWRRRLDRAADGRHARDATNAARSAEPRHRLRGQRLRLRRVRT